MATKKNQHQLWDKTGFWLVLNPVQIKARVFTHILLDDDVTTTYIVLLSDNSMFRIM
jgi:hypothetical protein